MSADNLKEVKRRMETLDSEFRNFHKFVEDALSDALEPLNQRSTGVPVIRDEKKSRQISDLVESLKPYFEELEDTTLLDLEKDPVSGKEEKFGSARL